MSGWADRLRTRLTGIDHMRPIHWVDERIVERPKRVVLLFFLLTIPFLGGLGMVSMESGTQQFTTGLPAEEALEEVNQEFSDPFAPDTGSTSIIQEGRNVLSKQALLRMLTVQERAADRPALQVSDSSSIARLVASNLDGRPQSLHEQRLALEAASDAEVRQTVREVADEPQFQSQISNDFNRQSVSASATIGSLTHAVTGEISSGAGQSGSSPLTPIQEDVAHLASDVPGVTIFGQGLIAQEFQSVVVDSLLIVVPAAMILILTFLLIAYRDPADLLLGLLSLLLAIVWTFGFTGLAGIPFSQMLIAVPPLLLAVGIDFGIHAINRYREELATGASIGDSMRVTTDQLTVAFFIVTGTTVIGFAANLSSPLAPIREFGIVAGIGIVFTFLLFGIFLPAMKVWLDRARTDSWIPTFSESPLGASGSALGRVVSGGVVIARRAPGLFLALILVGSALTGVYATGIDTSFSQEDFLPPEETPAFQEELPEPFRPSEYTVTRTLNFLEDNFESTDQSTATVYLERPMLRASSLEEIHSVNQEPADEILTADREAEASSINSVIEEYAQRDEVFRALVARHDTDGNGIPDKNLGQIYDYLLASPAEESARAYLADDYRSTRIVYSVSADASQSEVDAAAKEMASRFRGEATATGQLIVFQGVSEMIFASALTSLVLALVGASVFLVVIYLVLEGKATLGLANVVPIVVTVASVAGTMRLLDIPFNALTATMLAITIGLGIDYSVHVTHRFADERAERPLSVALERTVTGTGGALFGSMLTTVGGIGVLALAVFPAIGQFGILTAISIFYSFVASVFVLPSVLVVWDGLVNQGIPLRALVVPQLSNGPDGQRLTFGEGSASAGGRDLLEDE